MMAERHKVSENKRQTGSRYEELAARGLKENGWTVLETGYRTRSGDVATQILIQTNSRGHPLNVLVPRRLADKCSRYSFKKVFYPFDRSRSDNNPF